MHDVLAHDAPSVLQAGSKLYGLPAVLGSAIIEAMHHLHRQFSRGRPDRSPRVRAAPPRVAVRLESSSTLAHHRQASSIQVGEGGASSGPLDTKRDGEDITWIHLLKKLLIHR
jgi:hypothetical protein